MASLSCRLTRGRVLMEFSRWRGGGLGLALAPCAARADLERAFAQLLDEHAPDGSSAVPAAPDLRFCQPAKPIRLLTSSPDGINRAGGFRH